MMFGVGRYLPLLLLGPSIHALAFDWVPTGGGAWNSSANWSPATVPNAADAVANLASNTVSGSTITLSAGAASFTIGTLQMNSLYSYEIVSGGSTANALIFQVTTGSAQLSVLQSVQGPIYCPLTLTSDLNVNIASGGDLTISGGMTGAGS